MPDSHRLPHPVSRGARCSGWTGQTPPARLARSLGISAELFLPDQDPVVSQELFLKRKIITCRRRHRLLLFVCLFQKPSESPAGA